MSYRPLALLAVCAAILAGCGDSEEGTRARPAAEFVDSIGVNVHMTYTDTAYADAERVQEALSTLGVRHVRDGVVPGSRPLFDSLRAMHEEGIGATLVIGDPDERFGSGPLEEQLAAVKEELGGDLDAIESPNEYDSTGPDFASKLRDYQRRLASALERDPELRDRPLVGPSFINQGSYSEFGSLEGIDFGNMHPYPGGGPPEAVVEQNLELASEVAGDKPVYATETGYHNAVRAEGEGVQAGVPEEAAAVYLPRLYLENFRQGVERTFAYELLDQRPDPGRGNAEMNFGLMRSDFRPKPGYEALQNLIELLAEPAEERGSGAPGRLGYSLVDDAGVHSLLMQKSDGRFYLALWRADSSVWDMERRRAVRTATRAVEVSFSDSVRSVAAYLPSQSSEPRFMRRGVDAVRADLGAEAMVLEITPDE